MNDGQNLILSLKFYSVSSPSSMVSASGSAPSSPASFSGCSSGCSSGFSSGCSGSGGVFSPDPLLGFLVGTGGGGGGTSGISLFFPSLFFTLKSKRRSAQTINEKEM